MVEGASNLVALLEEGFDGKAWHGPNLVQALRGVGADEARWSPGPGRPSIWALTLHCAYWKHRVRQRVTGERVRFPREGRDFPDVPAGGGATAWRRDVRLLRESHASLLEAVRKKAGLLGRPGPAQGRARAEHLTGIAFHDVYHAGQIRVLRKLYAQAHDERHLVALDGHAERFQVADARMAPRGIVARVFRRWWTWWWGGWRALWQEAEGTVGASRLYFMR